MINVTKTFLPPQSEYNAILEKAWDNGWITNRGELVEELEVKLKNYLKVPNIVVTSNGTLSLQIAIKALNLTGEIITTPFSYVASTSSIVWEGCTPVFVDIHPEYLTIDESKIEDAITPNTSAILATHVFGNPCEIEIIESIAKKHDLRVIYDAAHCFGVTYKGESIFNYGDVSICSFHATKVFHTGEGGALFSKSKSTIERLFYHHNFGHDGTLEYHGLGINGKMSELQAAMGLAVLPYLNDIFEERKEIIEYYNSNLDFSIIRTIRLRKNTNWNFSYYPIIFESEEQLLNVEMVLNENKIYPRRYFYPSLNTISYVRAGVMNVSEEIVFRILCLPLYVELNRNELEKIVRLINSNLC